MPAKSKSRIWVDDLAPHSLFEAKEVPGSSATVQSMLSRMAANPKVSGIQRVHTGLYFKQSDFWPIDAKGTDLMRAAFRVAGPGAGMTSFTALNSLFWAWQVPNATYLITAADKLPSTPLLPWVRWEQLPGAKHRLELSSAECSLLEAVRWTVFVEREWGDILNEIMTKPQNRCRFWATLNGLGDGLRSDALREAAPLEKPTELELNNIERRATDLQQPLKHRIEDVATAIEARPKAEREGRIAA